MPEYDPNRFERLEIELEEYIDLKDSLTFYNTQQNKSYIREIKRYDTLIKELENKILPEYAKDKKESLEPEIQDHQDARETLMFENRQQNREYKRQLKYVEFSIEELQLKLRELN